MPSVKYKNVLTLLLVFAVLIGFSVIVARALYLTVTLTEVPSFSDAYVYVANILSGLVGGIVAVGFNQPPPPPPPGGQNILSRNAAALGNLITTNPGPTTAPTTKGVAASSPKAQEAAGFIYSTVYILLSIAAIVVWITDPDSPAIVENLATVSLGLFVPIVAAFFK